MNFPAYSPANVSSSHRVSPVRSSSMCEVHTFRREAEVGPVRPTHRMAVSSSTQNLMTDQRHESQGHHHHHHYHQRSNKPRRSHSFNERSTSGHSSSSSTNSSSSGGGSGMTEYPKTSPSHGYGTLNQYPLRETTSLQTLPSSASYGNSSSSNTSDGHHHKHGSHSHGHSHGQRSLSVRDIPSVSGYNTATTSAGSGRGRPIISQPMSGARVESVDIPSHPPPAAMVTHDLSSSYPAHRHGSRTSGSHIHGGTRGENPKSSRRHLHKVN